MTKACSSYPMEIKTELRIDGKTDAKIVCPCGLTPGAYNTQQVTKENTLVKENFTEHAESKFISNNALRDICIRQVIDIQTALIDFYLSIRR